MAINLHEFTGEERVDTELAPLLNENFNALKDYADDASRWQILPVQFSGDNVKYLLQETSLSAANTTYVLPLIKIDDTNVASACDLRFIILKENGSINGISADIKLQKISSTNCAVNYSFTPSEDITLEPCTFTYESVKYAGLKITVGADLPECIWANGFITETWQDAIAYKSGETVSNNEINNSIQVLGSDMVLVANMFKHLQTDKSPVSDYDVVNKKSLNDLTNVKTYSALSQIGLSGDVLDFHPYTIGNALPVNSMLVVGIGGTTNTYNYPITSGDLTVIKSEENIQFQLKGNDTNYNYILQCSLDSFNDSYNLWRIALTDYESGYWRANETVSAGDMRYLVGRDNTGYIAEYIQGGVTGDVQPEITEAIEIMNYGNTAKVGDMRLIFNLAEKDVNEILACGVTYNRATYPELWNYASFRPNLVITELEWQKKYKETEGRFVPYYSNGDGQNTFRTPLLGAYASGVTSVDLLGAYASDSIKKHNHNKIIDPVTNKELFSVYATLDGSYSDSPNFDFHNFGNTADYANALKTASLADVGEDETKPKTMYGVYVIKAIGTVVDSGSTDLVSMLQSIENFQEQLSSLNSKIQELEDESNYFTIIYPNGGTKENPANVTLNQVYVEDNPFPGYYVDCKVQIYSSEKDMWLEQPLWWSSGSYGVYAYLESNTDKIYVSTGDIVLIYKSAYGGSGINLSSNITTAPCRVLVYKLGKIEEE